MVPRRTSLPKLFALLTGLLLIVLSHPAQAQTEIPEIDAPQFLYRHGETLILVDSLVNHLPPAAGRILPGVTAGKDDHFEWSHNGQFLLVEQSIASEVQPYYCLNVYSLAEQKLLYDEYLGCDIGDATFSNNSTQLAFSTLAKDGLSAVLWLHNLNSETTKNAFTATLSTRTDDGKYLLEPLYGKGISEIRWSQTDQHVSFITSGQENGDQFNILQTLDIHSLSHRYVNMRFYPNLSVFYATYDPVWSPDNSWLLMRIRQSYPPYGYRGHADDQGDLYLFNNETNELSRLTYTPAEEEIAPHWTENGEIAFGIVEDVALTIDDALQIQPPDDIATPEVIHPQHLLPNCIGMSETIDPTWKAEVCPPNDGSDTYTFDISGWGDITYSVELSSGDYNNVLIGWRPR